MRTVYRVNDGQVGGGRKELEARFDCIRCPQARGRREGQGFDQRKCHEPFHGIVRDDLQRFQGRKGRGGVDTLEGAKVVYILDLDLEMGQVREMTLGKEQERRLCPLYERTVSQQGNKDTHDSVQPTRRIPGTDGSIGQRKG